MLTHPRNLGTLLVLPLSLGIACGSEVQSIDGQRIDRAVDSSLIGVPCLPSDELDPTFSGFDTNAITVESANPMCGAGVCVVDRFQGRVSCPEGQAEPATCESDEDCIEGPCDDGLCAPACFAGDTPVTTSVCSQCGDRPAAEAVYCSCLCGPPPDEPPDPAQPYCSCPGGFTCEPVARWGELAGAYCVREPTTTTPTCGTVEGYWAAPCHGLPQ